MRISFAVPGLLALFHVFTAAGINWPAWRGPDGTGISPEKNLPLKWSGTDNVRWRAELPERGNSSPIVWGDRVFVTQAVSKENRRTLLCFNRADGKLIWQSGVTYTDREPTQRDNPFCSATPVTDGERVIVSFGSAGLYCYDFAGKELWHRNFGKMNHMFGNGSSPIIAGDLCIFYFGPDEKSRLIAVNKSTGDTAWETDAPKLDPGEQQMPGGFAGAADGRGGQGGRGGFGIGMTLAPQIFTQADKNGDKKVTKDELSAVAGLWFDKIDTDKTDKLTQNQFSEKFYDAVPPPDDGNNAGPRRPSRTTAPAVFAAADADKNGSLTRAELKAAFAKWYDQSDSDNLGSITEEKLRAGLNAAVPRAQFAGAGPGAPGGRSPGGTNAFDGRGFSGGGPSGSWSTPILIKAGGREELIMVFPNRLAAYDPKTGKQLWLSKGLAGTIYTTPLWGEGALVAMNSGPGGGGAVAVKVGGSGDITESQRLWRLERVKSGIGSGVIHDAHLYTISQDGIASCLSLKDGRTIWEERLKATGSRGGSWSSMLLADGKIYVPNQSGDVFVLRASPAFEMLSTNSVNEPTNASLAASNGELFLRTDKALWCFANRKD